MMRSLIVALSVAMAFSAAPVMAQSSDASLRAAFSGAQIVDLRTSKVSSVALLRDKVGIPPPSEAVFVKVFDRKSLPPVLQYTFADPNRVAVTINGRYIAIIRTPLREEYADTLRHELVHAYITLASPQPLPLWFQEGSAVRFSMGKDWKFYGQPSKEHVGVVEGRKVELPNDYKQKLQSFNYMMKTLGDEKFYAWYKTAVETGTVDTRTPLGLGPVRKEVKQSVPTWVYAAIGVAVLVILLAAYFSIKRDSDYY